MAATLQASVPATVEELPNISELLNLRTVDALSDLMEFYRPIMVSLVKQELEPSLRTKIDASDIVQDACHEVTKRFQTIRARQRWQFWSYLLVTLRHKLQDARRHYKLAKRRALHREVSIDCHAHQSQLISDSVSPVLDLIDREDYDSLKQLISRLPAEIQHLLQWRFRHNMTYVEIGVLVDRSPDDVRILIGRCLSKIRRELEKHAAVR